MTRNDKLEGRSPHDCGWYDCEVAIQGAQLLLKYDGYGSDEAERLESLDNLRFSSIQAQDKDCPQVVPGCRVTAFKRRADEEIWVDATLMAKAAGSHAPGQKCDCSFTVEWLDTEDRGSRERVTLSDICMLDPRPLSKHPSFHTFKSLLQLAGNSGGRGSGAGNARHGEMGPTGAGASGAAESGGGQAARQVPDTPPSSGPAEEAAPRAQGLQSGAPVTQSSRLYPPSWADGPPCLLCQLRTVKPTPGGGASEEAEEFEGVEVGQTGCLHRRCALWSSKFPPLRNLGLNPATHIRRIPTQVQSAIGEAMLTSCGGCRVGGATITCSTPGCRQTFHMHCSRSCKLNWEDRTLVCPTHRVLGDVKPVPGGQFYPSQEVQAARGAVRGKPTATTLTRMLQNTRKRPAPEPQLLGRQQKQQRGGSGSGRGRGRGRGRGGATEGDQAVRRSGRQGSKQVRYGEDGVSSDVEGSDYGGKGSDDDDYEEDALARYQEDELSEDDFIDDGEEGEGGRARCGGRSTRQGSKGRVAEGDRKSTRNRKQVKTYDERRAEQEQYEEALKEAARGSGYEDTFCQVCHSKARAKEMLLCDGCDLGWHMGCLSPFLSAHPLANWFCPGCILEQECEACGKRAAAKKGRGTTAAAAAAVAAPPLDYCSGCGAACHPACLPKDGKCAYCLAGLVAVEAILGCRTAKGERREYCVKFKEASYRRIQWVREATAQRMAADKLARFVRDNRGAASVEPNVQPQWLEVERVISVRPAPAPASGEQCLVKWRGLPYTCATWERREEMEGEALRQVWPIDLE